jgi:hypothetical protein
MHKAASGAGLSEYQMKTAVRVFKASDEQFAALAILGAG